MGLNGYTGDGQDPKVVQRVLGKLRHLLADDERIHYVVVQQRPTLNLFPDSIVVTDKQLFLCEYTKMGLDLQVETLPWKRMRTIQPVRTGTGVTLKIISETEIDYIIEHIPGVQAEQLLKYAREQANGPKDSGAVPAEKPTAENQPDPVLEKLRSLYLRQRITRSEYESRTKKHQLEK